MVCTLTNELGSLYSHCITFTMTKISMPHVPRPKRTHWTTLSLGGHPPQMLFWSTIRANNGTTNWTAIKLILIGYPPWSILPSYRMAAYLSPSMTGTSQLSTNLIIDEASRYVWTFPRKSKEPPIDLVSHFLQMYGRHSGGIICCDQGGELAWSNAFRTMALEKHLYVIEPTGTDSPSQNAGAKKWNNTLAVTTRALHYGASLPAQYWSAALTNIHHYLPPTALLPICNNPVLLTQSCTQQYPSQLFSQWSPRPTRQHLYTPLQMLMQRLLPTMVSRTVTLNRCIFLLTTLNTPSTTTLTVWVPPPLSTLPLDWSSTTSTDASSSPTFSLGPRQLKYLIGACISGVLASTMSMVPQFLPSMMLSMPWLHSLRSLGVNVALGCPHRSYLMASWVMGSRNLPWTN